MRQVVLDTETTGLDWERGHRIIEIGCVEMINRRQTGNTFNCYLNPEREVDEAAQEIHGLSSKDLLDKPLFHEVAENFLEFVDGAELIIHNAPFDLGFLDNELRLADMGSRALGRTAQVLDTLILARQIQTCEQSKQGGLAGSGRSADDDSFAFLHREAHIAQGLEVTEVFAHVLEDDNRFLFAHVDIRISSSIPPPP